MKQSLLFVVLFAHLFVSLFFPANYVNVSAQASPFRASIDDQRTLRLEGTDAPETIIAEVIGDPASRPNTDSRPIGVTRASGGSVTIEIEYRRADGAVAPQKSSFSLAAFDRIVVNARGGADFVNVIDAAETLESQKKVLSLDGGEGENVVVISHLPFKPETAARIKQLFDLSRQMEDLARRASTTVSQSVANDAIKLINSVRVELTDVSKVMTGDAERLLFSPAQSLVERHGSRSANVGNSILAKSDEFAKQQAAFVADLTKKYVPSGGFPPDNDNEPSPRPPIPDVDRTEADAAKEKEASDVQTRAEGLAQAGLKIGDDAKAQVEQLSRQAETDTAGIEQRATEFERRAEQLSARAELLAASGEKDLTASIERVLAVVAELRTMEQSFHEAGVALRNEIQLAISMTPEPQAKLTKAGASGCNTPVSTTQTYTGGSGGDFFFPISASWQSWAINGGAGGDVLFGGLVSDDIQGGAGTDVICGLKGNDHISGDDGIDFLFGEFFIDLPFLTGDDCIRGGDGVDLVVGDNFLEAASGTAGGDDSLWGGNGIDIIIGDDVVDMPNFPSFSGASLEIFSQTHAGGKDAIEGEKDMDLLFGDGGEDEIKGNDDMDFAEGNGGNDVIDGGDGQNFSLCNTTIHLGNLLLGGHGDDDVTGGAGIDLIFGNKDNDKLTGKEQLDLMFGGEGLDKMYGDAGGVICVIDGVPIRLGNVMFGGIDDDKMWASGDLDVMFGQSGNDQVRGYDGSGQQPFAVDTDLLFGGTGNDYLEGDDESPILTNSVDLVFGNEGDDELHGGSQVDLLFGGKGKDRIHGDSNALPLIGSIDLLFGGAEDDWMDGGNSLDLLFGSDGNDTVLGDDETFGLVSPDLLFGGPGNDTMNGGVSLDFIFGQDGDDHMLGDSNLIWELLSADFMWGGPGPDYMDGGHAMDFIWGGSDCDTILGDNNTPWRISSDFIFGGTGNDDIDGGNSTDFIWGGDDHDKIVGDQNFWWQVLSNDWLWGDDGCDTILGGQALDMEWGGPGVDQLDGQSGPDMIWGGANSDVINGGDFFDFIWGNDGNDLIHGNDGLDTILGGDGDDCLYGDDGLDFVFGNGDNDCIHGGSQADFLFGNDGNDLILGDGGRDYLSGGSGDDKLDGGSAFDIIAGGSGNDEGWRGPGGALFYSIENKHNGSSGLECDCRIEVCTARICVHKFNDLDGDGIQSDREPNLQGWVFQVTANSNCVSGTLVTDANGNACGDFYPGTYTIVEQAQPGWTATTPTTQTMTVQSGQTINVAFGNKQEGCDLLIRKSISPNPAQSGQQVTVSLSVINVGTGTCQASPGTIVQDIKPAGLTFNQPVTIGQSGGLANWACSVASDLTCLSQNSLPPGYSATFSFPATVIAPPGSSIQNCSTVTNANDTNLANNRSCATLEITGCVTPPPGMVAWWPMDDPVGDSVVNDIAGVPNNGSPKPGPTIGPSNQPASVPGMVGAALNFLPGTSPTGPNQYVEVPTSSELNFGVADFTIDAWIKLGKAASIFPIVDKLDFTTPGVNKGYALFVQGGTLLLRIGPASGGLVAAVSTGPSITAGTWHHIAVTVRRNDISNKPVITFYINGVLAGSGTPAGSIMPASTNIDPTTPLWIGGNSRLASGGATVTLGEIAIDELEFFKRELNQMEIQAIFNAKSAGKCK